MKWERRQQLVYLYSSSALMPNSFQSQVSKVSCQGKSTGRLVSK